MQTLGERLEEARKRKGISVREAAETTKIRGDYLQKFEANSFDFDLPPLYIRGFLRTYAKFLELDPQRLVAEFDTLMVDEGRAPRRETRENYGRVDFGANESAEATSAPRASAGGGGNRSRESVFPPKTGDLFKKSGRCAAYCGNRLISRWRDTVDR